LLVQDLDLDVVCRPDTLGVGFATPRRWLADGRAIEVARAATAFGEVGFVMRSDLAHGRVEAEVSLPERSPAARTLMRFRLPTGWRVIGVVARDRALPLADDGATVDLAGLGGKVTLQATVKRVVEK
jgi:hypothetical protein